MAPPTRQRLTTAVDVFGRHPHHRRRARAAIEVFVSTTDGKIGIGSIQINVYRTDGMAQIPNHQATVLVDLRRGVLHRPQKTGAVIHMRQHHRCHTLI